MRRNEERAGRAWRFSLRNETQSHLRVGSRPSSSRPCDLYLSQWQAQKPHSKGSEPHHDQSGTGRRR